MDTQNMDDTLREIDNQIQSLSKSQKTITSELKCKCQADIHPYGPDDDDGIE